MKAISAQMGNRGFCAGFVFLLWSSWLCHHNPQCALISANGSYRLEHSEDLSNQRSKILLALSLKRQL